jgi:glutamine amidotransferase-like class 1 domain-containing protein 3, mitochondrial
MFQSISRSVFRASLRRVHSTTVARRGRGMALLPPLLTNSHLVSLTHTSSPGLQRPQRVCRHTQITCTCMKARQVSHRSLSSAASSNGKKVAVVLSGCGVYDGAEITEAVSTLVHLSRAGAQVHTFAPDMLQAHVINHIKGEPDETASRNVLEESARIARGNISPLQALDASGFDAVIFPGGFGAAKNLSSFAFDGVDCKVNDQVNRVITEFNDAKKPIGLCCIAPVLAAKVLGDKGISVTVGSGTEGNEKWPYAGTADAIDAMGAKHVEKEWDQVHVDNNIVTAPAYMYEGAPHQVYESVGKMVDQVLQKA